MSISPASADRCCGSRCSKRSLVLHSDDGNWVWAFSLVGLGLVGVLDGHVALVVGEPGSGAHDVLPDEADAVRVEDRPQREGDIAGAALAERQPDQRRVEQERSLADTTVTSTSPPSSALTSSAAVSPPKFPPITSTTLFPMTVTSFHTHL